MGDENKHIMIPAPGCGDKPVRLSGASLWLAQHDLLVGQVADLRAERDALRAEVERLRGVLASVEWGQCCDHCPSCEQWTHDGHTYDCKLAAALKKDGACGV